MKKTCRSTVTWVEWFNNRRLLEPIGDIPPAEYEKLIMNKLSLQQHDSNKNVSDETGAIQSKLRAAAPHNCFRLLG